MAATSYLCRVIYKEHTTDGDFAGQYKLLVKAKSIPAPVSAPNTVESTTLEDDAQTFEMGIKTSDSKEITGNLEKEYLDGIEKLGGKKLDIIHLYGTDGIGGVAKYAYVGQAVATPTDVGGADEILEMSVTVIPNTAAKKVTDELTVTDNQTQSRAKDVMSEVKRIMKSMRFEVQPTPTLEDTKDTHRAIMRCNRRIGSDDIL